MKQVSKSAKIILLVLLSTGLSQVAHADPSHCKVIPVEVNAALAEYDEMLEQYKSLMAEEKFRVNVSERESASNEFDVPKAASTEISVLSNQMRKSKESVIFTLIEMDKNSAPKKTASFKHWLACASIKHRIAASDLNRPSVMDRIKFINKRGKVQKQESKDNDESYSVKPRSIAKSVRNKKTVSSYK